MAITEGEQLIIDELKAMNTILRKQKRIIKQAYPYTNEDTDVTP